MDRDKKEKELLFQWACKNSSIEITEKIFPCIDQNIDSYFEKRNKESCCLREYAFQNLPEFKEELKNMWNDDACMDEIMIAVLAGAFKNRIEISNELLSEKNDSFTTTEELPQYIYGF